MKVTKTTLRFPSKTIQYGYAEVEVEFDGDWIRLGHEYREAVIDFQQGERNQVNTQEATKVADVLPATQYDERDPESPGVTTPEEAEALIKSELGATTIDDIMNEDVDEEEAPYSAPVTPPSDDDWDF